MLHRTSEASDVKRDDIERPMYAVVVKGQMLRNYSQAPPSLLPAAIMALAADKKKSKIADVDVPQEKRKREKRSKNRAKIVTKDEEEQTEKESKKRKRETIVDQDESAPPKKRKNKTGFLDPSDDSDLSEQAQKCKSQYPHLQFYLTTI